MNPAVFLDRDNTLIANDGDLGDPAQVRLLGGVADGLRALREAGYRLVVITNQGGVARGRFTESDVDAVHERIASLVDAQTGRRSIIDRFYYCPYHPEGTVAEYRRDHPWRKPQPGMLLQAADDLKIDLSRSWLVGDQRRDIDAGRSAGCQTVLVGPSDDEAAATAMTGSFDEAVQLILRRTPPRPAPGNGAAEGPAAPSSADARAATGRRRRGADRGGSEALLAAVRDLTEELRTNRQRQAEFTALRLGAWLAQLLAVLLALLGLLELGQVDVFARWMAGAALVQLIAITLLLLDLRA